LEVTIMPAAYPLSEGGLGARAILDLAVIGMGLMLLAIGLILSRSRRTRPVPPENEHPL
jgi:hypothetical protein